VPFVVRWPAQVEAGGTSDQLVCLTDLMATLADLLGIRLPANGGEDSVSFLPALLGRPPGHAQARRDAVVHHSINGAFAIRQARWKLALTSSSGGWSAPRPNTPAARALPSVQLYDLVADPGETNNVQARYPEVVERLTQLLERYVAEGRSTPGPRQTNTTTVDLWKEGRETPKLRRAE